MKKIIHTTLIALPVFLVACSLTPVSSRVPGYLTTPKGELLVSQDGQCWRTAEWRPALAIRKCDPEVVKQQEKLQLAQNEEEKVEEVAEEKTDKLPHKGRDPAGYIVVPPGNETMEGVDAAATAAANANKKPDEKMEVVFAPLALNSDTSFRFGDDRLTPDGRDAVIEMAGIIKRRKIQDLKVNVVGHTDRIGSEKANKDLSRRRAETVKKALVAEGIAAASIETGGMGATMPITHPDDCPNDLVKCELIDCLRPDRRVDIKVRGKIESGKRAVPVNGLLELQLPSKKPVDVGERRREAASVCRA
jgi:OOP family OmpA-OmpF porin